MRLHKGRQGAYAYEALCGIQGGGDDTGDGDGDGDDEDDGCDGDDKTTQAKDCTGRPGALHARLHVEYTIRGGCSESG